jgi:hypothetical protein
MEGEKMLRFVKEQLPNGVMAIDLGWAGAWLKFGIIGGPFDGFRRGMTGDFGVCVRAEYPPDDYDVWLPIRDFNVPESKRDTEHALERTLEAAMNGRRVYVGCMGGWGRTGLFLALLAKCCGKKDPVTYVRRVYSRRAVERPEQERYVKEFNVAWLQGCMLVMAWQARLLRIVTFRW